MIKIVAIDHLVLRTSNVEDMVTFYCDVLGCQVERVLTEFGLTQLRAGSALIDIVDVDGQLGRAGGAAPGVGAKNLDHFCLQIEAFDEVALKSFLQEKQIEAGDFAERYGAQGFGRSLYIKDPEANVVELKTVKSDI